MNIRNSKIQRLFDEVSLGLWHSYERNEDLREIVELAWRSGPSNRNGTLKNIVRTLVMINFIEFDESDVDILRKCESALLKSKISAQSSQDIFLWKMLFRHLGSYFEAQGDSWRSVWYRSLSNSRRQPGLSHSIGIDVGVKSLVDFTNLKGDENSYDFYQQLAILGDKNLVDEFYNKLAQGSKVSKAHLDYFRSLATCIEIGDGESAAICLRRWRTTLSSEYCLRLLYVSHFYRGVQQGVPKPTSLLRRYDAAKPSKFMGVVGSIERVLDSKTILYLKLNKISKIVNMIEEIGSPFDRLLLYGRLCRWLKSKRQKHLTAVLLARYSDISASLSYGESADLFGAFKDCSVVDHSSD